MLGRRYVYLHRVARVHRGMCQAKTCTCKPTLSCATFHRCQRQVVEGLCWIQVCPAVKGGADETRVPSASLAKGLSCELATCSLGVALKDQARLCTACLVPWRANSLSIIVLLCLFSCGVANALACVVPCAASLLQQSKYGMRPLNSFLFMERFSF